MFQATKKDVTAQYSKVVRVGYCDLQYLLSGVERIAYNAGIYGWNWDCYEMSYEVAIVTGYRNLVGKRCPRTEEFNNRARALWDLRDWTERKKKMEELRREFIEYCEETYHEWE